MTKPDDLVGQQIGPYLIQRYIASGGMAHVYLARNVDLQRDDVLKILNPGFSQDEMFVRRFRREAMAMARLLHPNIVQVYFTGMTGSGRPYIAMQYVSGGSLADRLAELKKEGNTLNTVETLSLVRQIAGALATAHRAGVIHRDLKPSNILLQPDGMPLLTDLGIAMVEDNPRLTRTDMIVGTPYYMSPEQIRGETVDRRSDIYSLGLILYELLAGMHPFDDDSQWVIIHKQLHEQPAPLQEMREGLSSQTQRLVHTCLEKEPDRRFQTAEQLQEALDEALEAERFGPPPVLAVNQGSRRWLYAFVPLLLLAAGFGFWRIQAPASRPTETAAAVSQVVADSTPATATLAPTPSPAASATMAAAGRSNTTVATALPSATPTVTTAPVTTAAPTVATTATSLPSATPTAVTNTAALATPSPAELTVVLSSVNLRSGPGVNYGIVTTLTEGTTVHVIARTNNGNWYNVLVDESTRGWLAASVVEPVGDVDLENVETAATIPAPPPTATYTPLPPTPTALPPPPGNGGGGGGSTPAPPPTLTPVRP